MLIMKPESVMKRYNEEGKEGSFLAYIYQTRSDMLKLLTPLTISHLNRNGNNTGMILGDIAYFFLSTTWPTYGDGLSIDAFVEIIQESAKILGYKVREI